MLGVTRRAKPIYCRCTAVDLFKYVFSYYGRSRIWYPSVRCGLVDLCIVQLDSALSLEPRVVEVSKCHNVTTPEHGHALLEFCYRCKNMFKTRPKNHAACNAEYRRHELTADVYI